MGYYKYHPRGKLPYAYLEWKEPKVSADRTNSPKKRAGSRRNKKYKNVPSFLSDRR